MKTYQAVLEIQATAVLSFVRANGQVVLATDDGEFSIDARRFGGEYGGDMGFLLFRDNADPEWIATRQFNALYAEVAS